jgi:transcriptional antiterminator RfaH
MRRGKLVNLIKPLFLRYLFVQLDQSLHARSWGFIRSTLGVNHLVKFGSEAVGIQHQLIDTLKSYEAHHKRSVNQLFKPGQKVLITKGPFTGIEAVYQITDGQARVIVLIELLSKLTELVVDVRMVEAV